MTTDRPTPGPKPPSEDLDTAAQSDDAPSTSLMPDSSASPEKKQPSADAPPATTVPLSGSAPDPGRYLGCTIDNRYKVEEIIGEGGMGVVYKCRHKIIDKRVALKILRADVAQETEVTERFLIEAKAASAIADEHIINISDFGQLPDGAAYFVMEFLEGTPLSELVGTGTPMPVPRLLDIAIQLSEGLAAAHQRGIVHRDLKPDNVFLIQRGKQADFVKILDFGIAKVTKKMDNRLTQAGSVFGTPHYMSPEQAGGSALDHRSDVYSLGIMLYELSTGLVPFDGENFVGILSQQLYETPIPPRQTPGGQQLPEALNALILKCLEKPADKRFQSMQQLREELLRVARTVSPEAAPAASADVVNAETSSVDGAVLAVREPQPGEPRPRRWPLYVAMAAPMAVVLVLFGAQIGANRARMAQRAQTALASPPTATAPEATQVLVGVAPTAAHVLVEGLDRGMSPVSVSVPRGKTVSVTVQLPGYQTQHLLLDGSTPRQSVELKPLPHPPEPETSPNRVPRGSKRSAARTAPTAPAKDPSSRDDSGGGQRSNLLVKPWKD